MSYEIVKAIKIKDKEQEVWIKSDSNNVVPKTFKWWEAKSLSKIYKEQGREQVEKEILKNYFSGNFQRSNNNFENSLIYLDKEKYNWDTVGQDRPISEDELKEVLHQNYIKYMNRQKGSFVIYNIDRKAYITKFTRTGTYLSTNKKLAKVFTSKEEAEVKLQEYKRSNYEIEDMNSNSSTKIIQDSLF